MLERALSLLNHELIWQGIVEACKILKYPEPSATHREYFEAMFDMSCFIWFQMYLNLREQCLLIILLTILFVYVN